MTTSLSNHSECATASYKLENLDDSLKGLLITASARVLNIAEIRESIMLQLDPSTLLRLISVSPAALATFERDSANFFDTTLNNSDISSRRWAIAILEAYWKRPAEDLPDTWTYDGRPLETELDSFLNKFVKFGDDQSLPEDIPKSLESLRKLASVHDAASDLLASHLWTGIENPEMCNINPANIWKALWIYQLYCELFHRPGNAVSPDVLFPSVEAQRKYLRVIRGDYDYRFLYCLCSVYRDLSSFLAGLFHDCWPEEFCKVYKNHSQRSDALCQGKTFPEKDWPYSNFAYIIHSPGVSPEVEKAHEDPSSSFWSSKKVVWDTHGEFFKYIDYQMSIGLPYIAHMYRMNLANDFSAWEAQNYRTDSFFPQAYDAFGVGHATLRITARNQGFILEPVEEGAKGYHLTITVPTSGDDYFARSKEPIFTDGDFTPLHMGNLMRLDGRIEEDATEETAGDGTNEETSTKEHSHETPNKNLGQTEVGWWSSLRRHGLGLINKDWNSK